MVYQQQYNMWVDILFTSNRTDCNLTCIYSTKISPTTNFLLPLDNGTMVDVYSDSGPLDPTGMFSHLFCDYKSIYDI